MSISTLWVRLGRKMDYESFDQVVEKIKSLSKPPHEGVGQPYDLSEHHFDGKEVHNLNTFQWQIYNGGRFEIIQVWNYCPECKKALNTKVVGLDNRDNQAHTRYFIKHGESERTSIFKGLAEPMRQLRGGDF